MTPPVWPDSEFAELPPAPKSNDPLDVARFVDQRVAAANRILRKHMDQRFNDIQQQLKSMHACMLDAFPDKDPGAHRRAHEAQIDSAHTFRKLRFRVTATVFGATILGACSFVGFAVMREIAALLGRGLP